MGEYIGDLAEAQRAIELLQEDLDLLQVHSNHALPSAMKGQMISLDGNLGFIRSFLKWLEETPDDHQELQPLLEQIKNAPFGYSEESTSSLLQGLDKKGYVALIHSKKYPKSRKRRISECSLRMDNLVKEIRSTGYVTEGSVSDYNEFSANEVQEARHTLADETECNILAGETMVGFDDEKLALLEKLMGNQKQLEVISITGMAGIGKTTLAQRLYNDQAVVYHFHNRCWTRVSQSYQKRKVLSSILSHIPGQEHSFLSIGDEDIGERLYKCLKGQRYLIVIDDIWDIGVWNDIKMYFPDDFNRSRILITTRITDVASKASSTAPYFLPFLSPEQSWHLFTCKVFDDKSCPHGLMKIGKRIVAKCKGLPLAIVVVAGLLLKKEKTLAIWSRVAEGIGPLIDGNEEQVMDILAMSFKHLPQHLKLCFLYLGTFPEDYEIPVKDLIWSWTAEGYVKETEEKRLEDAAEDYLMELINRSLVMAAKKRSNGGIKTCLLHDMMRELCFRKALEKKLIMQSSSRDRSFISTAPNLDELFGFNFIRVLDLRQNIFFEFPMEIFEFILLKYLALHVEDINLLPRNICFLKNLETFILRREKGRRITLPNEILNLEKLRHIHISGELEFEHSLHIVILTISIMWLCWRIQHYFIMAFEQTQSSVPVDFSLLAMYVNCSTVAVTVCLSSGIWKHFPYFAALPHLQTISQIGASGSVKNILARAANIRKLGFHLTISNTGRKSSFPNLTSFRQLESLKFEYQTLGMQSIDLPPLEKFPQSLKKLTLIGSHVNWEQMSILGMLPNLEVLKIKDNFFSGPRWETSEDGFRCLKFLRLSHMDLQHWIASECHFPNLEQLVLNACFDLEEIPSAFGDIYTLQVIKVYRSSSSVVDSAWKIQETQRSLGNDEFKVLIYPQIEEHISCGGHNQIMQFRSL